MGYWIRRTRSGSETLGMPMSTRFTLLLACSWVGCSPPTGSSSSDKGAGGTTQVGGGDADGGDGGGGDGTTEPGTDADGDGVTVEDGDCDDTSAAVAPGAVEICNDGVDDDCDGLADDADDSLDASTTTLFYEDIDGDGFGNAASSDRRCAPLDGQVDNPDDCDDGDATAYPGAVEVCGNLVDEDCSSALDDRDADADGVRAMACGGDDCDDEAASVYPGAPDAWYDGVDADCAGDSDYDADGDGFDSDAHGGTDCDDAAASTFPGASDAWYDGVDADCAGDSDYDADGDGDDSDAHGGSDCDDTDPDRAGLFAETWYDGIDGACDGGSDYDADLDGEDSDLYGGPDCDDGDATVNTARVEVWYDGVDADCDGASDYDADLDGDDSDTYGGGDCDDTEPTTSSLAVDVCGDGIDNDCDGSPGECALEGDIALTSADATFAAVGTTERHGTTLVVGDFDGDGLDDLGVGAPGRGTTSTGSGGGVYVYLTAGGGTVDVTHDALVECNGLSFQGAETLAVGDIDGDGVDDLFLGGPEASESGQTGSGGAWVQYGPFSGTHSARGSTADLYESGEPYANLGAGLAVLGDVVGGSGRDLAIGAPRGNYGGVDDGVVYVFDGPPSGHVTVSSTAYATVYGEDDYDYAGQSITSGDTDGDGIDELILGAYGHGASSQGAVYVFEASGLSGTIGLSGADAKLTGEAASDGLGQHESGDEPIAVGDVDGDGLDDLVAGALNHGSNDGKAYLVLGTATGLSSGSIDTVAQAAWTASSGGQLGEIVELVGDVDGDGVDDLAVSATNHDVGATSSAGAAFLFYGPFTGATAISAADATLYSSSSSSDAGRGLAALDVDDDGTLDLVVGSPHWVSARGKVDVFLNEGL